MRPWVPDTAGNCRFASTTTAFLTLNRSAAVLLKRGVDRREKGCCRSIKPTRKSMLPLERRRLTQ